MQENSIPFIKDVGSKKFIFKEKSVSLLRFIIFLPFSSHILSLHIVTPFSQILIKSYE